jgi:capsid assembly protease
MQFNHEPMALLPEFEHQIALGKLVVVEPKPLAWFSAETGEQYAADVPSSHSNLIAVVPVYGMLTPDGRYGASLDGLARTVTALDNNPNVSKILLNVTSPGGTVTGTPEASEAIRRVRDNGNTPIVALANGMMASGALWVGAAASEIVITPSGEIGSIGVISMYADVSKAYEAMGVKVDVMRIPNKKARFSGVEPMTEEMRRHVETRIAESYERFKRAMATNRGIRIDQVEAKFGGGEMLNAERAVEAGLADRIGTLEQTLARMQTKRSAPSSARAALAKAML